MNVQRAYTIEVEMAYTTLGQGTSADLVEEIKRCERSIRNFLKERGCRDVAVVITCAVAADP